MQPGLPFVGPVLSTFLAPARGKLGLGVCVCGMEYNHLLCGDRHATLAIVQRTQHAECDVITTIEVFGLFPGNG